MRLKCLIHIANVIVWTIPNEFESVVGGISKLTLEQIFYDKKVICMFDWLAFTQLHTHMVMVHGNFNCRILFRIVINMIILLWLHFA